MARPTEVSRALETTTGSPASVDDPQRGVHAAERLRLDHQQVGGPGRGPRRAGRRPCARSRRRRSGCPCTAPGRGSRRAPRRSRTAARHTPGRAAASAWMACSASSMFQPPLASMRTRPSGPRNARTAATRATSSARVCPRSATLTFTVRQPGKRASTVGTPAASTAGSVAFTGIAARRRRGRRLPAEVDCRGEPGGRLGVFVLEERRELGPALRPLDQHRFAFVDAAEPGGQRQRHDAGGAEQIGKGRGHAP